MLVIAKKSRIISETRTHVLRNAKRAIAISGPSLREAFYSNESSAHFLAHFVKAKFILIFSSCSCCPLKFESVPNCSFCRWALGLNNILLVAWSCRNYRCILICAKVWQVAWTNKESPILPKRQRRLLIEFCFLEHIKGKFFFSFA